MKCKILSVQKGISQKSGKEYFNIWLLLPSGEPVKIFDNSGRQFSPGSEIELVIVAGFDGSARVQIK